jgi:hypothetical protein
MCPDCAPASKVCGRCYAAVTFAVPMSGDELASALVAAGWRYVDGAGWMCKDCRVVGALEAVGEVTAAPPGLLARYVRFRGSE